MRVASCPNNTIVSALLDRAAAHARAQQHGYAVAFFSAAIAADDSCHAQLEFGLYTYHRGDLSAAIETLSRAWEAAKRQQDWPRIAAACQHLASAYRSLGNAVLAQQHQQLAITAELKCGSAESTPPVLSDAVRLGAAADRWTEEHVASDRSGASPDYLDRLLDEGITQFQEGRQAKSLATFAKVYRQSRAMRDWLRLAKVSEWLGELFRVQGEWRSASRLLSISARLHRRNGVHDAADRLGGVVRRIERALGKLETPVEWN